MENKSVAGKEIIPFVVSDLVRMVMEQKRLCMSDALSYICTSKLYSDLENEELKLWYQSTPDLFCQLETEKARSRKEELKMRDNKILLFKIYCLEHYSRRVKLPAISVVAMFQHYRVFGFIEETYEMLHTQDENYIMSSIAVYIRNQKKTQR